MISVKEAQAKILDNCSSYGKEKIPLNISLGRILFDDIISPVDHPFFNQSAVDGYAIRISNLSEKDFDLKEFKIIGELKAGDEPKIRLKENESVRIFTGASVPIECDAVIMQEDSRRNGDSVSFTKHPRLKANIRLKGEQIKTGDTALEKGEIIKQASIGFLASLGISEVCVSKTPTISIIVTGNEFISKDENIREGKIYESNGVMLKNILSGLAINSEYIVSPDEKDKLLDIAGKCLSDADILLITGGVSVGDYDFTTTVIQELGFEVIFHKVAQKPGKPILFAKKNEKVIFGLPGNPRSVFVCFYEYVYPFINKSFGRKDVFLPELKLPISKDFIKKDEKAYFLAGKIENDNVTILEKQDSHMLKSLSHADALIAFTENKKQFYKGDIVTVHLLP